MSLKYESIMTNHNIKLTGERLDDFRKTIYEIVQSKESKFEKKGL
jgi:hypothetical protein